MRKLAIVEFVTLDGVMQSFGSPDEDRDGGFEHGGWGAPYFDEAIAKAGTEGSAATSAYLLGRKTYEKMAGYWPDQPDENLYLSSRNLPNVLVLEARHADPVSLVRFPKVLLTRGAVKHLEEALA